MANGGSDAERLETIQSLERAIRAKQPAVQAAQVRRDAARQLEARRRQALDAIETRIKGIGTEIHQQAKGTYLNGEVLDRGTLSIGNEALKFSGWHGTISVPLQHIHHIDTGMSSLSPYDGVPILGRLIPGQPRKAFTLLLTVEVPDAKVERLVVVADLPDAAKWVSQILARQGALSQVHANRDELMTQREQAQAAQQEADSDLQTALTALRSVEGEVSQLQMQQNKLWEQQRRIDQAREEVVRNAQTQAEKGRKR